ncbi:Crp/Fnr family transcriptional regulator [Microvirga aerophila]|uniref:Crp/Fnr family transcriptional regulator n=1 Tax=Microvirga aerophila TaxID=670291 RepID=A0A512C465_9HYPH|nr:Crp/Fnr family transcriptional regulator [Microvirga aerophila]GEO18837.1 Crp/Fnr family transcriptional regulator [Microvirga aerophila]
MLNPFIMKLERGARLTDEDRQVLEEAVLRSQHVGARKDLIHEGDVPDNVHLIVKGFACRYKTVSDGQRQIMAYLVPGDLCDLHVSILGEMDHSIATLCPCEVVYLPRATIEDLTENHSRINRALWWVTLVDEAILREWIVNMGRRPADRKLAHLLCELLMRLQSVGLATENSYEFSVTQADLGDTLGLSSVHVNRVLQQLRSDGLIGLKGRNLIINDVERLKEFAEFNPNYLHLKRRERDRSGDEAVGPAGVRESSPSVMDVLKRSLADRPPAKPE